jgi:hypothetical protein
MPKTALKPDQKPQRRKFDHRGAGTIRPVPRLANAGTPDKPAVSLGIANFLPPLATQLLVNAAQAARQLPEGSIARRMQIENAIVAVKNKWAMLFR